MGIVKLALQKRYTFVVTAMIIGMLHRSFGFGEGGEQNAPLGRAVIGGLFVATLTTLLFVPIVYSLLRRKEFLPEESLPEVTHSYWKNIQKRDVFGEPRM